VGHKIRKFTHILIFVSYSVGIVQRTNSANLSSIITGHWHNTQRRRTCDQHNKRGDASVGLVGIHKSTINHGGLRL